MVREIYAVITRDQHRSSDIQKLLYRETYPGNKHILVLVSINIDV